jgi:predicted metal-dependent phosphoesterase TrpH
MSGIDLHVHTTASDGRYSPAEIVRRAAVLGLAVIGISDHDTVEGIVPALEAAKAYPSLVVIPAVELSTDVPKGEVHMLGYFVDYTSVEFKSNLDRMRFSRFERALKMVEKIRRLGLDIDWQRVQEIAGEGILARPHIAQALLEKGYVTSFQDAFIKYIGRRGPAYVEREKVTPKEAVELILKAGGLPVMAHPLTVGDPEETIVALKLVGMVGLEVYYARYTSEDISHMLGLAQKYGLIPTGGTDYHGIDDANETMMGGIDVPMQSAERLIALAKERGLNILALEIKENA